MGKMIVTESTLNEALKFEDIESLIEAGAPDDEYTPEARSIVQALAMIDEREIAEENLAGVIRSVWSRSFGPFSEEDLEMRMPAFRKAAHRIMARSS
jgi:hypothetical protein